MRVHSCAGSDCSVVAPAQRPRAVRHELELEVLVRRYALVGDLVYTACRRHLVGFRGGIPILAVYEGGNVLAVARYGDKAYVAARFSDAVAGDIDLAGVGVIGNGNVAVLAQTEVYVRACARHAVPLDPLGVAAVELYNLYLVNRAAYRLD